jgi:hypothetical protein
LLAAVRNFCVSATDTPIFACPPMAHTSLRPVNSSV